MGAPKFCFASFVVWFALAGDAHAELIDFGGGLQIDFTIIGDAGNPADTAGSPNQAGSVGYEFRISTFEISRAQVEAAGFQSFLSDMTAYGGNGDDRPATGISWFEAAQFVNYLNTSQGFQAAYKFFGASYLLWESGDAGYDASNQYRNSLAQYWLPDVDEWYKAAYYDPVSGDYFDYTTGSNSAPTAVASGTTAGTAVFAQAPLTGPADVNNSGGLSAYGVMGMGGNAWEWMETASDLSNDGILEARVLRGGTWNSPTISLLSANRIGYNPTNNDGFVGFRVAGAAPATAAVPEPTTVFGVFALVAGAFFRRKRRVF